MAQPFSLLLFLYGCVEWWNTLPMFQVCLLEVFFIVAVAKVGGMWEKKYLCTIIYYTYRSINSNAILHLCLYLTLSPVDRCHAGSHSLSETWCARLRSCSSQSFTTCFHACTPSVRLISGTKCLEFSGTLSWFGMDEAQGVDTPLA